MDNTEDFFKNYRGKYSQYWIERWGLIPELPTSFDNANSIYELVAWLQRAFKNLLDDFQQLEAESEDFKNALIDLLEYLIPELIRRYHDSAEFRTIFIGMITDILSGEERTWLKDFLKQLIEVDMVEWFTDYLNELLNETEFKKLFNEVTNSRGTELTLSNRLGKMDVKDAEIMTKLAQKANKDEVTSVTTPKGTLPYTSLPITGNQIGWYYYCPDGDRTHGAGNYVWNGSSWFFGGTGDTGYTKLKNELNSKLGIDTVLLKSLRADYNEDVPMDNLSNDFVYTLGDLSQVPKGTTKINLDIYSGGGYAEIFLYKPDATYQRLLVFRQRYNFIIGLNKVKIDLTDEDFGNADYLKIAIFSETVGAFKTQAGSLYKYTNGDPFTFYMEYAKIDTTKGGYVDAPIYWVGNVTTNKTYPCIDVYFTRPVEKRKKSVITVSQDGTKDFTTIMEAVRNAGDCDNNHVTILIYEGVYDEVVYLRNKHNISLKGINRDNCIIKNTTGQYYASPVMVNGDFTIENLTVRMEENGFYPEYTDNVFVTYPGYALHVDGNSKDVLKETTGRIKNCTFYSEAFPAVGMGVNQNQTIIFENCDFVRNCTKEYFKRDNWRGAFVGHSSNYPTAPNQNLIIKNCIFKSNYGYAGNIRGNLGDSSAFTLTAINNTFYSTEMGKDSFEYTVGQSHLHPMSNGNTATNLNAN